MDAGGAVLGFGNGRPAFAAAATWVLTLFATVVQATVPSTASPAAPPICWPALSCLRRRLVMSRYLPGWHVVLRYHAIDRPRITTRQVRGHHQILVIRRAGTAPDRTGPQQHVNESWGRTEVRALLPLPVLA